MQTGLKLFILLAGTAGLLYISRVSLRSRRSHGFYRFFAWEALLGLTLLNLKSWFVDPFSLPQILSWLCLCLSLFLVIHAVRLLQIIGKTNREREDAALLGLEKTTELVMVGAYRYIRHPMYSSLLFLAWGIFFKAPSWPGAALAVAAAAFLAATAQVEEGENMRYFGPAYAEYMKKTKMFIPFLF